MDAIATYFHLQGGNKAVSWMIQYILAFFVFVFSTLASWYEGSEIRSNPWEWKYSAFFSQMLHGSITNSSDISQLDHFIYAAKFKPAFPLLMALSIIYIVMLTGYWLCRRSNKRFRLFYAGSLLFWILGAMVADSPTIGGHYFTMLFMTAGAGSAAMALLSVLRAKCWRGEELK